MASLREIKDRIGSVRSTLKITSAMKLVASSKLRKAQKAIETLRPYEEVLSQILAAASSRVKPAKAPVVRKDEYAAPAPARKALVLISSNSSLCGGFNANAVKKALEILRSGGEWDVYAPGRKGADSLRSAGFAAVRDDSALVAHPSCDASAALAALLSERFGKGEIAGVTLVYNHFVSTARQEVVAQEFLPFSVDAGSVGEPEEDYYIMEPSPEELVRELMPQVLALRLHAAILDSAAAEHAARTIAMQMATDNATDLLAELTLEYNKGRQQKITAEILDLIGGSAE